MKFRHFIWQKIKKEDEERIIVLDVSALKTQKAMLIIEEASKIILLTGTIRELDKVKKIKTQFGINACIVSKNSREDKESQKYICVSGYEQNNYQDDNIITYCKENKNAVILTNDNNLCNMAKAFKIPYIFCEDEETNKEIKPDVIEQEEIEELTQKEEEKQIEKKQDFIEQEIVFSDHFIHVKREKKYRTCMKLERQGVLVRPQDYQKGDILYILKYNLKNNELKIHVYDIVIEENKYVAKNINKYLIWYINDIYKMNCSEELKDEIWKFFRKYVNY